MNASLFVTPHNGSKITLQKRKWTFITDVFKVSEKKTQTFCEKTKVSNSSQTLFTIVTTMEQRTGNVQQDVQCSIINIYRMFK